MKIIVAVIISMLFGLALCCSTQENNQLSEQEYAVYLTVVGERPENFIVVDETVVDMFGEVSSGKLPDLFPGILQETIDDYALKNRKPSIIPDDFPFKVGHKVISREENVKLMSEYNRHYVGSRVGFSKDGKQAFVLFHDFCEPLCSEGAFYLLSNKNGVWMIETKSESWKS
jgi:hypothetical protein